MTEDAPTPPSGRTRRLSGSFAAGRQAFDDAYERADRILDRGQGRVFRLFYLFLPGTSVARETRFQAVMASRFLSDAGQQALAYGALIAIVRSGGSAFEAALVGVAALLPPALFGIYGGAVADALPKRVALAAIYNLQAVLCLIVPLTIGDGLGAVFVLLFAVNALGQVSGPTESSVVPYVATQTELASAASLLSFSSNLGTAFGTALLAPILVRAFGTDAVFYTAAILLFLAASRVFDLSTADEPKTRLPLRRPNVSVRSTIAWLIREPAVGTMIIVAVLAGTANVVLQTLAPRYVREVLGVDPADAVYVFAPSAIGLALALLAGPSLIRRYGERIVALTGFAMLSLTLVLLGFADNLGAIIDPINPIRVVGLFHISLSEDLRTAGFLAIFIGFGVSLATTSVQTYLNRRVPIGYQGRAFALQSTLKNGASIVPLLVLGGIAAATGVQSVLIVSPLVLLLIATTLVRTSAALGHHRAPSGLNVFASFWEESDAPVSTPDDSAALGTSAVEDSIAGGDHEHAGAESRGDEDALGRPGPDEDLPL